METVDVIGTDHAFQGIPINDGVAETFRQLLQLPQQQAQQKVEMMGRAEATPGQADYGVADLRPGRYGVACFLPVGGGQAGPPRQGHAG
ncbi:MAG: hypothetical protein M3378_05290 [Actinomycetota bacterium]|nr:hypothetical protein [Actinomycetota bacterium]